MAVNETELRQRNVPQQATSAESAGDMVRSLNSQESKADKPESDKKTFGRTPDGIVFTVPETKDMVSQLLSPTEPKNIGDIAVVSVLLLHALFLYILPQFLRVPVFAVIYLFWRTCYNAGIGYLLYEQSNYRRLVRWAKKYKTFEKEGNPRPWLYQLLRREMETKIPKDYKFEDAPVEFNTWLLFRRLTDLILMSDFVTYCLFAVAATNNPPPGENLITGILRWTAGIGLVAFNLWVKLDAHRVVKDYAWYWGDFFFLVDQELTFDGVFEMAPHPMYSVGYAGFYGISLMAASYKVLFISIIAHAAQFAFLVWVENPHIEKTYSQPAPSKRLLEQSDDASAAKEDGRKGPGAAAPSEMPSAMHNVLGLHNFDFFRLLDTSTFLLNTYMFLLTVLTPSTFWYQVLFVFNAALWRLWYALGIGYVLNRQSAKKNWTRHFVKYGEGMDEAWRQWRGLYYMSMTMTYASFMAAAWKVYQFPTDWAHGTVLLNHVLGAGLIALQVWTAFSIYEELGEFGWFFGDFFYDNASKLTYGGIYRFLNNPERVIGLAGVWGSVLVTRSPAIFFLALLSHVVSLIFIHFVERPHMQKRYGASIREDSGLSKSIRRSLPPPFRKWQTSVDKMLDESFDFVEEFIDAARPKIAAGVDTFVKDTTVLFQQPTRLTITKLEPDMAGYDPKDYSLEVLNGTPTKDGKGLAFTYGDPIRVKWTAPLNHSKNDWIGLYNVADNASWSVTRVASAGRWCASNPDHWDDSNTGDGVLSTDVRVSGSERKDGESKDFLTGELEFAGDKLFWKTGSYEFRYHHNGKHNVMAISRAFEVRINRFDEDEAESGTADAVRFSIEQALLPVVRNCLDGDPQVAPSTVTEGFGTLITQNGKYSKRVVYAIGRMFGIEFAPEVVQADGNVKNLAWRIMNAKKVLAPYSMASSRGNGTPTQDKF